MENKTTFNSKDIIRQIHLSQHESIVDIDETAEQLVIFSLGHDWFAFSGQVIREILPYTAITYVPGLPAHFLGIINVRGDLESVIDLSKSLHINESKTDPLNRILLTKHESVSTGFRVDYVHDIIELPLSKIRPVSNITDTERAKYFTGEFEFKTKTVIILNMNRLLEDLIDEPNG
jgi:purine-binding chemotaxis protein CheW